MVTTRASSTPDRPNTRSSASKPSSSSSASASKPASKGRSTSKPSTSSPAKPTSNGKTGSSSPVKSPSASAASPGKPALVKRKHAEEGANGAGGGEEGDNANGDAMKIDGEQEEKEEKSERPAKKVKFDGEADTGGEVVGEAAEGKTVEPEEEGKTEGEGQEKEGAKTYEADESKEGVEETPEGEPLKPRSGILERGSLYFLYRPKVQKTAVSSVDDIARTSLVLVPRPPESSPGPLESKKQHYREIRIGKKALPTGGEAGQKKRDVLWACTMKVGEDLDELKKEMGPDDYDTKTSGPRHVDPSRLAVRGCYLIYHNTSGPPSASTTYLYYALTHPSPSVLSSSSASSSPALALGFSPTGRGSFIIQLRNPTSSTGPNQGLPPGERAEYGSSLINDVFGGAADGKGGTRFSQLDRVGMLDFEGAELLLIGEGKGEEEERDEVGEANAKDLEGQAEQERKEVGDEEALKELGLDVEKWGHALDGDWV